MNTQFEIQSVNVRYIVNDLDTSVDFYVNMLGFRIIQRVKSAFASLSLGDLNLFLNRPGAGGAGQTMPDGAVPEPGGWNRFQITVKNIESAVENLANEGARFRNNIITGVGGKQILLEDPSGNLIELFELRHDE